MPDVTVALAKVALIYLTVLGLIGLAFRLAIRGGQEDRGR